MRLAIFYNRVLRIFHVQCLALLSIALSWASAQDVDAGDAVQIVPEGELIDGQQPVEQVAGEDLAGAEQRYWGGGYGRGWGGGYGRGWGGGYGRGWGGGYGRGWGGGYGRGWGGGYRRGYGGRGFYGGRRYWG
jgi:hypothetical protein